MTAGRGEDALGDEGEGAGERTIFQPSPLQERRARAAAAPPPPPLAQRALIDDDMPAPPPRGRPRNPLTEAAAPLLALIAAVRAGRLSIALPQLHQRMTAAAMRFDEALQGQGLDEETRRRARYAVFATIDDVAQNLPGRAADGAEWARRSMVVRGFGETIGGDRFWALLQEMLARPADHAALIELYHACLAAGFEGRHRIGGEGGGRLRQILTSAYAALPHARQISPVELVPHWRGTPRAAARVSPWAPLTLAASGLAALLLLIFVGLRLALIATGGPALTTLLAINPDQPLRLARAAAPPPSPPDDALHRRVSAFLADAVARGLVVVEEDPNSLRVRTTVGQLFASGSDRLEPGRAALFQRIAAALEREPGPVRIEGHTDSARIATLAFPDNLALARARAETVAALVRAGLSDPGRVTAIGFGAAQPIASNASPAGRALNRRVEIVIPRSQ
ncbi:type IVB secretion system protein IcmH/DotU [Sphingomonas morindae]|uniref:Type IVB secretion system protein IcmH/DotU n=1 Tax=Sphingomonas morindae TaxID=1541170 RepID=A0ABY4XD68_9SPHN|nr:type IVB secretion system protein IcmH/DotU [Sphingomonas morindae]USI74912.1 type IVB secretion system protein IcmH/DotU [Sphingomonas morindae]